jgi:hypothetical protein
MLDLVVPLMLGTTATEMTMLIGASDAAVFARDEMGYASASLRGMKPGNNT